MDVYKILVMALLNFMAVNAAYSVDRFVTSDLIESRWFPGVTIEAIDFACSRYSFYEGEAVLVVNAGEFGNARGDNEEGAYIARHYQFDCSTKYEGGEVYITERACPDSIYYNYIWDDSVKKCFDGICPTGTTKNEYGVCESPSPSKQPPPC